MGSKSDEKIQCIDSCVILRVILQDIPELYAKARDFLMNGHDYYVDDVAIMEIVHVLTKDKWARKKIAESILVLLRNSFFVWNRDLFEPVFKEYLKYPSLSFDDLVMARRVEMRGYSCLWTLDKKFANQSKVAKLVG